jgi:hypothetical protein
MPLPQRRPTSGAPERRVPAGGLSVSRPSTRTTTTRTAGRLQQELLLTSAIGSLRKAIAAGARPAHRRRIQLAIDACQFAIDNPNK